MRIRFRQQRRPRRSARMEAALQAADLLYDNPYADACLTCLRSGIVSYPIDPAYHFHRTGHRPRMLADIQREARERNYARP